MSIAGVGHFVLFFSIAVPASAQEQVTDQVGGVVLDNEIFAATHGEGLVRIDLSAGEKVIDVEARGINAPVQTSKRLLGFSGVT